ncbi:MAG: helix-turn-helix domain-containing protein [Actinomycetota bacterium]|nr:helix-turn-helix domain-containing protein [Actinomycetota bacterium]
MRVGDRREIPELREVSDPLALRALAHPVRIALIEALSLQGPMTATEAGEMVGESPTTCSFHLRQLAKYGVVEEAGRGKGRARPWKMTSIGMRISAGGGDPEAELAAVALTRLFRDRQLARYRRWIESRSTYPKRWQDAVGDSEYLFHLTVEELEALNGELSALLLPRFRERLTDPASRPAGSVPVEMLVFSYLIAPPPPEP